MTHETEPATLQFSSVRYAYRKGRSEHVEVLRGLSFTVSPGERVALVGRSGSGKSTVLNLSSGRLVARQGTVKVAGHNLAEMTTDERADLRLQHIAHVHQDFRLMPRYGALDNVALPLLLRGFTRAEARERAREALEQVDLAHRASHVPKQLSGGEQQRVAIARAVVRQPTLLLADEPTGSLDSAQRDEILDLMLRVCARSAILVVTHDPAVAKATDRSVELER